MENHGEYMEDEAEGAREEQPTKQYQKGKKRINKGQGPSL